MKLRNVCYSVKNNWQKLNKTDHTNMIEKLLTRQVLGHELPKFDGKIADWPSFYSIYQRTTHEGQFTEIENIQRLRKSLEGAARNFVEMILLTNDVSRVIKILEKSFGNKHVMKDQILERVQNTTFVNNSKSFLQYSKQVENLVIVTENF